MPSEAMKEAIKKYKSKMDKYQVIMPAGRKEEIRAKAEAAGESLNAYIIRAIDERIERDDNKP